MRRRRVPCLGGSGAEGASPTPHPNAERERGGEGAGRGSGLKGLGGRGRWLQLEEGNSGHPLTPPARRGLFGVGGNGAGAGWAG